MAVGKWNKDKTHILFEAKELEFVHFHCLTGWPGRDKWRFLIASGLSHWSKIFQDFLLYFLVITYLETRPRVSVNWLEPCRKLKCSHKYSVTTKKLLTTLSKREKKYQIQATKNGMHQKINPTFSDILTILQIWSENVKMAIGQ